MIDPDNSKQDPEWERMRVAEEQDAARKAEPSPNISKREFLAWRSPREVVCNPTRLDNSLWGWLVCTRWNAYQANEMFHGPSPFEAGPMWVFDRFGMSETKLPDGRVIYIGGEHEDHYDPDFHIYNDVIVIDSEGGIAIYGYPKKDFHPTDFHTATLIGGDIYIVGRLGYPADREKNMTPVYKLSLATMRIEELATFGDCPGWIYSHSACLETDGRSIKISGGECWFSSDVATYANTDEWVLNIQTLEWKRAAGSDYQQWIMRRADRNRNRLWEIRQELWYRKHINSGFTSYWSYDDQPDFESLSKLYCFSPDYLAPTEGEGVGEYSVIVDGLTVRFKEHGHWVEVIVEGQLVQSRLLELQQKTLELLERLDLASYAIESNPRP